MDVLQHPIIAGAVAGFLTATAVDFQAFRAFQTFGEFKRYNWTLAGFRAVQGVVIGAVSAAGIWAL